MIDELLCFFFFSSRRRHTRWTGDWSSDVCSSDLIQYKGQTLHHAWETWMKKAEGKAAIDYGFHMIMTEVSDQLELEMEIGRAPSELQSPVHLVCRLLLEKKKNTYIQATLNTNTIS